MGRGIELQSSPMRCAASAGRSCRPVMGLGVGQIILHRPNGDLSARCFELALRNSSLAASCRKRGVYCEPLMQKGVHFGGPGGRMVPPECPRVQVDC